MKIITGFLFIANIIAWIAFDVVCWSLTGATMGIVVLIGIISFLIAWAISGETILSVSDYFLQPEWCIFVSKMKWANTSAFIVMAIFVIACLFLDWLGMREFSGINF